MYRYFAVAPNGITHTALSSMEDAGSAIVKAFDTVDGFHKTVIPVSFILNGQLKGFSLLPNIEIHTTLGQALQQGGRKILEASFNQVSAEVAKAGPILYAQPAFAVSRGDKTEPLVIDPKIAEAFLIIVPNIVKLGLDPNIAIKIAEFEARAGKPSTQNPQHAVMTLNNIPQYPEAYRIGSAWMIKMPPYIPVHGNDYTPPDAQEISPKELSALTASAQLEDFSHDHARARARILNLQQIDIGPHLKK